jgi:hypothetical protein
MIIESIKVKIFSHKLDGREHLKTITRKPILDNNGELFIAYRATLHTVYWNGVDSYYINLERAHEIS